MSQTPPPEDHHETEAEREAREEQARKEQARKEQEARNRAAQSAQQKMAQHQTRQQLNREGAKMAYHAQQGFGAKARGDIQRNKQRSAEREAGDFAHAGPRDTVRHSLIVLAVLVVVFLNFFLNNAPVNYIAGSVFADPDAWQAQLATVIVPIALLLLELYISQQLWIARQEQDLDDIRRWQLAGTIMIAFTPLMIIGTMLAREDWYVSYNFVTSIALILLAGITDAAIVFGGKQIHTSQAFIWFQVSRWQIQSKINHHDASYRKAGLKAEQAYVRYAQILNAHNETHATPLQAGPFSRDTTQFLNEWFGDEVIAAPNRPPRANQDFEPPASPVNRPAPKPVTPGGAAVDPELDDPRETEAERDYYQMLLASQVRRSEREVRPD